MADGLDSLEGSLTKDVGGVPVWVIGGGAGIAIALVIWLRNRNSGGVVADVYDPNSATPAADAPDPTNADYGLPNGPAGDWLADNPGSTAFPVGGVALPSPITNLQWARQAIDGLLGRGYDPTLVNNAIAHYISGQYLSTAERSVINLALTTFGSTPEGVLPLNTTPPAVKPVGNRGYGWYKIVKGDSAKGIASKYGITLATYYAFNGPGRLIPGKYAKVRAASNPLVGYTGK